MDDRSPARDVAVTSATILFSATVLLALVDTASRSETRAKNRPHGATRHGPPSTRVTGLPATVARVDTRLRAAARAALDPAVPFAQGITPIRDWRHRDHVTYDSVAGWWISESLGIEVYHDHGVDRLVGRYARGEVPGSYSGHHLWWRVAKSDQSGEEWLYATLQHREAKSNELLGTTVTNLASRRNPRLDERTQLAHMLWCATILAMR